MVENSDKFSDLGVAKPAGPRRVRVTIEFLPEPGEDSRLPLVMEYANVRIHQDQGVRFVPGNTPATWDRLDDIQANGHYRASIHLWSGCESFETFRSKTTGLSISPEGHTPGPVQSRWLR